MELEDRELRMPGVEDGTILKKDRAEPSEDGKELLQGDVDRKRRVVNTFLQSYLG